MTVIGSSRLRVSRPALVFLMCIGLAFGSSGASAAGESGHPSIRSDQAADDASPQLPAERGLATALEGLWDSSGVVTVEIVHISGIDGIVAAEVSRLGGKVLSESAGLILAEVPATSVRSLEGHSDIGYVRQPVRVDLIPETLDLAEPYLGAGDVHVIATNASAWHSAGRLGQGVKIGIIDRFDSNSWVAAQASGALPSPADTFCQVYGTSCSVWNSFSPHGVAVAEVVYDMAPAATLYLATAVTASDLAAAVAWFDSQGVQIITRSLVSQFDGPGDGTGSIDAVVDDAVSRGMAWFNAAGNHASSSGTSDGGYWRGTFIDTDVDGWLEFAPGDEALGFFCGGIQGFRWSDWQPSGRSDYDILITDFNTGVTVATSVSDQTLGAPPLELIDPGVIDCGVHPVLNLWVHRFSAGSGTAGDVLEFMVNGTAFEYSSNPYSVSEPAVDSANPGMMAVGAIDPAGGSTIASYSSQGPTNDGRVKPDLSAPSCLPNVSYAPNCFNGTSAATPVATGAAALVWGAGVATTPTGVTQYLRSHVIDRGPTGPDTVFGSGQLYLGTPPSANKPPTVSAGPNQTITLPAQATLNASVADDGLPYGSLSTTWTKTSGPGNVSFTNANAASTAATFPLAGTYVLRNTVSDGQLSASDEVQILVNPVPPPPFTGHTTGLVDPASGQWNLYNESGAPTVPFYFGNPGDYPYMGDWNCNGIETPGLYRQSDGYAYLRNSNTQGNAEIKFFFGDPGDVPIAGDFNGDGCDTLSIYRPSNQTFYVINKLGQNDGGLGTAEFSYVFGNPGDKPFVGDFDGDGVETVGLHRETTGLVYFRNSHTQGNADNQFIFGDPGDRLVAGDWNSDGMFSPALFRPSNTTMYFRYTNTQGNADKQLGPYLTAGSAWLPVAGKR